MELSTIFTVLIFIVSGCQAEFDIIILHNNDMHARFEQIGVNSNACLPADVLSNNCYGGFARVATELKKFRTDAANGGTPVLYLNAGDTYTGTPWFTHFKDKIVSEFLNLLKPDAISLGNHEFDLGVEGVVPFLNAVKFPVLAANLNLTNTPELEAAETLRKSVVLNVNGTQIGIIGYLTPETKYLTPANTVEYNDEIQSINEAAQQLKQEGVNIIIALGHSGFETDKLIAKNCPEIDLVIGGHSNTFLYNGDKPNTENPDGPYPVVVIQDNGKNVPVAQAFAYTKYLGYIKVKFDNEGNLLQWDGQPILLNGSVPNDPEILDVLEIYRPDIEALRDEVIGVSKVFLDGSCRKYECNLGNLITDAIVYVYALNYNGTEWTDAPIALMQGGGIRASGSKGNVTNYDLMTILPFGDTLTTIIINGSDIRIALEHSVARYDPIIEYGEFLQMSGIQVVYNMSQPSGQRVHSVLMRCSNCTVPRFYELEDAMEYKIIITQFLHGGGDGFDMFKKTGVNLLPTDDSETVELYIKHMTTIYPAKEWRITFIENFQEEDTTTTIDDTTTTIDVTTVETTTPAIGTRSLFSIEIILCSVLLNLYIR